MKRLVALLLLAATFSSEAQEEIIPISPNGVWTMQSGSWVLGEFVANPPFGIGIESIVDFNDTAYFQFSTFDFCDGATEYSPYFLIREDSGKYYYRPNAVDGEHLWFDFTLEIGDTIYLEHCYQDIFPEITSPEQLTVLNIEPTTLDNGSIRRKWTLQYSDVLSGMYLMTEEWIEGIGSVNRGWEKPLAQTCVDSGIQLRCYYENGDWVDAFGAFDGAISDTNCCDLVGMHEINQSHFIVFPNPTSNELTVQSTSAISMITITDRTGRIVFTMQPNCIATKVNIESLPSGYYFVFATTENGRIEPLQFMKSL